MAFDYIYGLSADQYSFYRIPKSLMFGDEFRDLSLQAKLLYGLLPVIIVLAVLLGIVKVCVGIYSFARALFGLLVGALVILTMTVRGNADRNGKHMTRRQRQRKERKRLNTELRWESSLFQNASCSKN